MKRIKNLMDVIAVVLFAVFAVSLVTMAVTADPDVKLSALYVTILSVTGACLSSLWSITL
jgi:hypothetical protein